MKRKHASAVAEAVALESESDVEIIEQPQLEGGERVQVPDNDRVVLLTEDRVLIIIKHGEVLYLKGKVDVQVLHGGFEVLGALLDTSDGVQTVYSPRGYSLLCLASRKIDKCHQEKDFELLLDNHEVLNEDLRVRLFSECVTSSIAILSRNTKDSIFINRHLVLSRGGNINLFGRDSNLNRNPEMNVFEAEKRLNINLIFGVQETIKARLFQTSPEWDSAVTSAKLTKSDGSQPRIIVAGGKGVGKSTFLKFLANRLRKELESHVLVIDLDPGQGEFAVTACLTCTVIKDPILGPNFTHLGLEKDLSLFLGAIEATSVKERYVTCLKKLGDFSKKFKDLPVIINTMGFNTGLGIELMRKTVSKFKPTTIVEIFSRFHKKNFDEKNFFGNMINTYKLKTNLLRFVALPESANQDQKGDVWGIPHPGLLRDIVMLAFLDQAFQGMSLKDITPRAISWSEIYIQVIGCSQQFSIQNMIRILNTGFVSLGFSESDQLPELRSDTINFVTDPRIIAPTTGFGIIRSIDIEKKLFYILTNLDEEALNTVNCATMGTRIRLPDGVIASQKPIANHPVPFMAKCASPCMLNTPWQKHNKPKAEF